MRAEASWTPRAWRRRLAEYDRGPGAAASRSRGADLMAVRSGDEGHTRVPLHEARGGADVAQLERVVVVPAVPFATPRLPAS